MGALFLWLGKGASRGVWRSWAGSTLPQRGGEADGAEKEFGQLKGPESEGRKEGV